MRKLLLAAAAALVTLGAYAQYRPTFIVSAGYQGATLKSETLKDSKIASGARAGIDADFSLYDAEYMNISLRPGVHFSMKGAKYQLINADFGKLGKADVAVTDHLYYVDVPVLANFGFNAGEFGVFLNAGPYLGFGVASSRTTTSNTESIITDPKKTTDSKSTDLFGENGYNRFDWGAQLGAGIEYRNVLLGVGTQFGIGNLSKVKDVTIRNSDFFVTLGYRF